MIEPIDLADVYPEDWRELGWCCRECGVMAWYGMDPELRRELHPARQAADARTKPARNGR
jgi:hypothetical protein